MIPYRDSYILNTTSGKKLLKKTQLIPERICFVHGAKEHLFLHDFPNTDRYICAADGNPYSIIEGITYTVIDAIDGNECNFENRSEMASASRLLASMHKASRGFISPLDSLSRDELGKLPSCFSKRLDEIKKLKNTAKKGHGKFDYLFLNYFDYFYMLADSACSLLASSHYDQLVQDTRMSGLFCHHDFAHQNIILSDSKYIVTNFDSCCFELKVYDVANLIRRKMRKCDWDLREADLILNEYSSIEPISQEEFLLMKIILQFPQKFWRVINKYYNSKRSWSEKIYLAKLQEVIDEVEHHRRFMEGLDRLV